MHATAALAAGLALIVASSTNTASAFLIPPNHKDVATEAAKVEVAQLFGLSSTWTVELECPGCPWAGIEEVEGKQVQWSNKFENTIQFEIDTNLEHGLVINNVPTIPFTFGTPRPVALVATQKRKDNGDTTLPFPIDFALERLAPFVDKDDAERMIVPIRFTVLAFGGRPVKVDTLAIDIFRGRDSMQVLKVENIPFKTTPGALSCEDHNTWSVCRVRAMLAARIAELVKVMKAKAQQAKGWAKGCGQRQRGGRPSMFGGQHHHHQHHRKAHRFGRVVHQALRFFIIPALLGVIGGLMASAIGMLAGQLIVFLWVRFGQKTRRSASSRSSPSVVEVLVYEDEKDGLLVSYRDEVDDQQDVKEEQQRPTSPSSPLPPPPCYEDVESGGERELL